MSETRALHVELRAGEAIKLDGGRIVVQLMDKTGKVAQLRVTAPDDIDIQRPNQTVSNGAAMARTGIMLKANTKA